MTATGTVYKGHGAFHAFETVAQNTVVKRTAGFYRDFDYVAETTVETPRGLLTVKGYGHTAEGAVTRAELEARDRVFFVGTKRTVGFGEQTVARERTYDDKADFDAGFAVAA